MNVALASRPAKAHYSESEAAAALDISVEELRSLIRDHIVRDDNDMANLAMTSFQPSDLLVLRILTARAPTATVPY